MHLQYRSSRFLGIILRTVILLTTFASYLSAQADDNCEIRILLSQEKPTPTRDDGAIGDMSGIFFNSTVTLPSEYAKVECSVCRDLAFALARSPALKPFIPGCKTQGFATYTTKLIRGHESEPCPAPGEKSESRPIDDSISITREKPQECR